MAIPQTDNRSPERRARDEQIAAEPMLPSPDLTADAVAMPMESHRSRMPRRKPLAVMGIVENGLVRPLDSAVRLEEKARVIIVASESA